MRVYRHEDMVVLESVVTSKPSSFSAELSNDKISIFNSSTGLYEVANMPWADIKDINNASLSSANDTKSYLDSLFIPLESKVHIVDSPPFANKILPDGKKLFTRVHGEAYAVTTGSNILDFSIPYGLIKFNEIELIGAETGDKITLRIKDDAYGTYTTVPDYTLNTFGTDVYCGKDYYKRSSNYDAELYNAMRIYTEYTSISDKTVYVNYILHEVV